YVMSRPYFDSLVPKPHPQINQETSPVKSRLSIPVVAAALALVSSAASAQPTKTMTGETITATATVEAIDHPGRILTLKDSDGNYEVLTAPTSMKRFDSLKIGDKVKARYYENVVVRLKGPGEKDIDTATGATTKSTGVVGGTMAAQRAITATITAIDPKTPSITFTGPNGWSYSTRVHDTDALAKVKVG